METRGGVRERLGRSLGTCNRPFRMLPSIGAIISERATENRGQGQAEERMRVSSTVPRHHKPKILKFTPPSESSSTSTSNVHSPSLINNGSMKCSCRCVMYNRFLLSFNILMTYLSLTFRAQHASNGKSTSSTYFLTFSSTSFWGSHKLPCRKASNVPLSHPIPYQFYHFNTYNSEQNPWSIPTNLNCISAVLVLVQKIPQLTNCHLHNPHPSIPNTQHPPYKPPIPIQ